MSAHTPGPWHMTPITNACWDIDGANRCGYAEGHVCRVTLNEADARLIAVAPELLAALVEIADPCALRTAEGFRMIARAAIAKATPEAKP